MRSGSIRESMQVTRAMPAWALPSKPPRSKESAKARLASIRSLKSSTRARLAEPYVVAHRARWAGRRQVADTTGALDPAMTAPSAGSSTVARTAGAMR